MDVCVGGALRRRHQARRGDDCVVLPYGEEPQRRLWRRSGVTRVRPFVVVALVLDQQNRPVEVRLDQARQTRHHLYLKHLDGRTFQ